MLPPTATAPVAPTTAQVLRRADPAYVDVAVPYCQAPAYRLLQGDADASADAGPPTWQLNLADGTLQARLARAVPTAATLAALDDPFACSAAVSTARLAATAVNLATAAPVNASAAYTAYLCPDGANALGYAAVTQADGGVSASFAAPTPGACPSPTPTVLAPIAGAQWLLQAAPANTTGAGLNVFGNFSWPNAAAAALCGPIFVKAAADQDFRNAFASLQSNSVGELQNSVNRALGPVGGPIVWSLMGATAFALAGGTYGFLLRRSKASTAQADGGESGGSDAVALTTLAPLGGAAAGAQATPAAAAPTPLTSRLTPSVENLHKSLPETPTDERYAPLQDDYVPLATAYYR